MIRALIVVDVPFYREGVQALLLNSGEVHVVGAIASTCDVATAAAGTQVVLLDIAASHAREVLARIRQLASAPKVIALAVSETPQDVLSWAEAGVSGYVSRTATSSDLIRTLRDVLRDELHCSPQIAATLMHRLATLAAAAQPARTALDALTERERDVLSLLAEGLPNKVIAARLRIQPATAKNHVHNILHKLDLRGRSQAAVVLSRERSGGPESPAAQI